jgi:hypothetical protein
LATVNAKQIVNEAIEAHGGTAYWNSLEALDVVMSAKGFLFTAKQRPILNRVHMRCATGEPRFSFFDFPKEGLTSELIGTREVRILDSNGNVLSRRDDPRAAFHGVRRLFKWDDLDFIYFGGYANWNYLTAPFLLDRAGVVVEALAPLQGEMASLIRLQVTFPDDIPTHSRKQIFYFDDQRMIRRLDYTAEPVGGWAHAAHLCGEYRTFGKLTVPTRRWALPLPFGHKPLPGPRLVDLEVHDVRPVPA